MDTTIETPSRATDGIEAVALRWRWWILGAITLGGAILRSLGVHDGTLTRDDAWIALSARVPVGTALHMLVTTPGFTLFERTWIGIAPAAQWWAQLPSLIAGIALVPVVYWLLRSWRFATWLSLLGSLVASWVPIAVVYSTHVKTFAFDALWVCLLLALAERSRTRHREASSIVVLAMVSILATWWSLSLAGAVAGIWVVIVVGSLRRRDLVAASVVGGLAAAASLLVERSVLRHQITSPLTHYWNGYFLSASSWHSIPTTAWRLLGMMTINRGGTPPLVLGLGALFLWVVVVILAIRRAPLAVGVLAAAAGASMAHLSPLGTGRTDISLIPVLIVLVIAALDHALEIAERHLSERVVAIGASALLAGSLLLSILLAVAITPSAIRLPNRGNLPLLTDLRPVHAAAMAELAKPGTVLVVEEPLWVWADYFVDPVVISTDPSSLTGFTVTGRDPRVILSLHADGPQAFRPPLRGSSIEHATRIVTVRPSQIQPDPVGNEITSRFCILRISTTKVGDDLLTTYLKAPPTGDAAACTSRR